MFRTSDGVGLEKIYLCGYTPTPIDKFGNFRKDFSKVALGAEKSVPWEHISNTKECIEALRSEGYKIVAVEECSFGVNYKEVNFDNKTAFIFGNEVDGIPDEILEISDTVITIPMLGTKKSLNVSVSYGIILYHYGV